jgi:1-deoxy-D-xylulose-5-phosphate reductoisomerase
MTAKVSTVILGATGSIGTQTLDVIQQYPSDFELQLITANTSVEQLHILAQKHSISSIGLHSLSVSLPTSDNVQFVQGRKEIADFIIQHSIHTVVFGSSGIEDYQILKEVYPYVQKICIASKEIIVMAGATGLLKEIQSKCTVLPVDSEHAAVYQLLERCSHKDIKKVYLTASGGPFYSQISNVSTIEWDRITPEMALKHPTWNMGQKVTMDSATMANKGIELLEASVLFSLPASQLDVIIHPQSIVHAMVECIDGVCYSQNSWPDMRLPIAFALFYPEKKQIDIGKPDSFFTNLHQLSLYPVHTMNIPTIASAYQALQEGGLSPIVYLAADDVAVEAFLQHQVPFSHIPRIIQTSLDRFSQDPIDASNPVEQYKKLQRRIRHELIKG